MKKDLLPTLNFLDCKKFRKHSQKNSKFAFLLKVKYKLLLISFLCCSLQAQNNTFTSSGTFTVAAGLTSVTAECWGAGGAGGGNNSGTSAGGGGGGGYSKAVISVTPNTSINYTVGLGPAGSNASGLDGAATVFSTLTAYGGKGGTSGSPGTGGLGGTGTIGTGGKGANGSLVIGSVYSGGGGSSAGTTSNGNPGTGLGAGGAAVTGGGAGGGGAVLAGDGSPGAIPGGGGGGGLVLLNIGNNKGGNGGNGQIKLTYTCPTYNISETSAGTACTSIGDVAIRLTSTTSALPQGNYTVTYTRGAPSASGLTAPMTVDGSGVGTFTAAGFTTVGTTSIIITKIESGTCSSTLNLPNAAYTTSVTVYALSAGGSVAGGTTICSGFTSAALTLSGHTGTVLRWESSVSPFTTWSPVSNATTSTTYTSLALTQTTQFRAVVQNGPCNAIESTPTTVTVNTLPSAPVIGTITGPTCTLATGSIALSGLPSGGVLRLYPGNIVQSYSGTTALISGLSPNTYFFTISSGACTSVNSANAVVPLVPANSYPTISTSGAITVCQLATTATMVYTATTVSPVSYSIQWTGLANQTATSFAFAAGGGTINNIVIPTNTPAGTYNGIMTIVNTNGCSSTQNVSLTVNANPTITTGGTATAICASTSALTTSLNYNASTFSPTSYSIQWTGMTNQTATSFAFAAGGGSINTIAVPANTAAGNYTGIMTISNANGCSSTQNVSLTVNANPTITTGGTITAICASKSAQTTSLNYTASTFSPTSYSIQWTGMANQTATSFAFTAGGGTINTIAVPANTAAGNYTGIMTISNANGCSSTQNVSLTVNANPTITTGGTATAVCQSTTAQTTSLNYTASTFSPTSYSIQWTGLANQTATSFAFTAGGGTINTIAVPANTAAGNYTGIITISNANGCSSTQNVSLTVNANPTITTGGAATAVCASTSAQTTSLNYTASTFSPTSYSIQWTGMANQTATSFAFAAGGGSINTIVIPANTAAGNYTGIMTISNANGCSSTQNISLTVNASPTITTTGVFSAVCQSTSDQPTSLNYNSTTGSPVNYAIDWVTLTDQGVTILPFSSGSGTVINVNVPANTAAGTYNGVMTISTANGCPVNQAVSLTVNAVSAAPTASATQQPSCESNSGSITVSSPASGTGYFYSIDGVDFTNNTGVFTALAPGLYNVKVRNGATGCESPSTPITINTFSTKVWNGSVNASWANPSNWTPAGVPLATDCVTIPDVGVNPVISGIDGNFFANRLTIENEGSLIVEGTNTITVTNEIKVLGNGIFMFENNASLLQTTNAVNTGNIIYKRSSKPMRRYDVTHWSSPVTRNPAFRAIDFSPATLVDKYNRYDPATGWIEISPSEEMVKGVGYSIRAPQPFAIDSYDTFHGEFIGVPNNGDILGPTPIAGKYVFLGNPYPSSLYADQFIYDNQDNIYGTLLIWTHNTLPQKNSSGDGFYYYSDNDYAFYNLSGSVAVGSMNGTGATNPGNQDKPEGYIAAGQGFLVRSKTNQKVLFTNSMRKPGRNSQFFKSAASIEIERHRVWLNLSNAQGAFKQLLIGYATGATNFWDNNFDALSVDAHPYIDFYSINEGKKLVIQGRALPFTVSDSIPLGYRSAIEGEFTIAIDHKDGNLNNQAVYLQDNVTKKIHDLSTGNYTFTTKTGVYQKRFVLRYMDPNVTLGNEDFTNLDRNISVAVKDKNITMQSFSDDQNLQEVSVYDVGGKLLYNKNAIDNKEWIITNLRSGPQVLLVKIKLDNGQTVTRKIVYN